MNLAGINLAPPTDWNTDLPFADLFRMARAWVDQESGINPATGKAWGWGNGPIPPVDPHGYPLWLQPGCFVETLLPAGSGGPYTLLFDGDGTWKLDAGVTPGTVTVVEPGECLLMPAKAGPTLELQLATTNPVNPVRNVRCYPAAALVGQTFAAPFLARTRATAPKCLRFMNWGGTNNSTQSTWSTRPTLLDATWTTASNGRGVPIEVMCDLANALGADPWFCIPHMADDNFVRAFAALVLGRLDPHRRVYVEYSNEPWNGTFGQSSWMSRQGLAAGLATAAWPATVAWYATRTCAVHAIWYDVFGPDAPARLVRVLSGQAGNADVLNQFAGYKATAANVDVLAFAPYLGIAPHAPSPTAPTASTALPDYTVVRTWSVDQVVAYLLGPALTQVKNWIAAHQKVAAKYGKGLVCYEGGQGCVGGDAPARADATLTALFKATNNDPRMADVYAAYLACIPAGVLFNHFNDCEPWGSAGCWGLQQDGNTPTAKAAAWQKWAAA